MNRTHEPSPSVKPHAATAPAMGFIFVMLILTLAGMWRRPTAIYPVHPQSTHTQVNINTADAYELSLLPEIGFALANRIIEYRRSNHGFTSIDQLENVSGIGPITLDRVRPYVDTRSSSPASLLPIR